MNTQAPFRLRGHLRPVGPIACCVIAGLYIACLLLTMGVSASPPKAPPAVGSDGESGRELGTIDFPTSASPAAQDLFVEGVLYLHSFEYEDARRAFREARKVEPSFAMAYWGEAMTFNHPIWLQENRDEAVAVLEMLGPTPEERAAMAPTAREKAYLATLEILFGEGSKRARDLAYAEAMKELKEAYPEDLDAASFYALALLGTCHDGRDTATYMQAAAVAEEVFAANPRHPGATHYLIHAYDDPVHAPLGLRAARVYADIAPAAEHALHMPSHIFLALGRWPETVASNIDSWEAAEERVEAEHQPVDRRGYHALLWMHYALLQQGDLEAATDRLLLMAEDVEISGSERTRGHFVQMRAHQIVATQGKGEVPPGPSVKGLGLSQTATHLFAEGYAALQRGDTKIARGSMEQIRAELAPETKDGDEASASSASGGYTSTRPRGELEARVMALELDALLQQHDKEGAAAVATLQEAVALEEGAAFGFGPPIPVKPAAELLGEMLLQQGEPEEAAEAFRASLRRNPGRALSERGLQAALTTTVESPQTASP